MTLEPKWLQKVKFTGHLTHTTGIKKNRGNTDFKNAFISAVGLVVPLRFVGLVRMTSRQLNASISAVGVSVS